MKAALLVAVGLLLLAALKGARAQGRGAIPTVVPGLPTPRAWGTVNSCSNASGTGSSITCTVNGVTAGHSLVAALWSSGSGTTTTASDSASDSWTQVAARAFVSGVGGFDVWATCSSAGGNVTVTESRSGSGNMALAVHEISGLVSSSCADKNGNANGTGTAIASSSVATTQASEYLFGVGVNVATTNTVTANSPWTGRLSNVGGATNGAPMSTEDRVVSATGSFATSFTGGTSSSWNSTIVTFKMR